MPFNLDYFYGNETEQFRFYRIPKALFNEELSLEAVTLYGLMRDRVGLSIQNGRADDQGRVYIYFVRTVVPAAEVLLHICLDKIDVYPALIIGPAVPDRESHPVQHQAIERHGLQGEFLIEEGLGNTIKTELLCFVSVEIIQIE